MPKKWPSLDNEIEDLFDVDSDTSDEESDNLSSKDGENSEDETARGFESDEEEEDIPLRNWKQIQANKSIDFGKFSFTAKPDMIDPVDPK